MKIDHARQVRADPAIRSLIEHADTEDLPTANAVRLLCAYSDSGAPLITSGRLTNWLGHWDSGMRPAIESANPGEAHENSLIARAALRVSSHLHGLDVRLRDGLRVAVGEQLVVTGDHRPGTPFALAHGALLEVTGIHPTGCFVTVDIPTTGEQRHIPAGSNVTRHLAYGYATSPAHERGLEQPGAARQPGQGLTW